MKSNKKIISILLLILILTTATISFAGTWVGEDCCHNPSPKTVDVYSSWCNFHDELWNGNCMDQGCSIEMVYMETITICNTCGKEWQ